MSQSGRGGGRGQNSGRGGGGNGPPRTQSAPPAADGQAPPVNMMPGGGQFRPQFPPQVFIPQQQMMNMYQPNMYQQNYPQAFTQQGPPPYMYNGAQGQRPPAGGPPPAATNAPAVAASPAAAPPAAEPTKKRERKGLLIKNPDGDTVLDTNKLSEERRAIEAKAKAEAEAKAKAKAKADAEKAAIAEKAAADAAEKEAALAPPKPESAEAGMSPASARKSRAVTIKAPDGTPAPVPEPAAAKSKAAAAPEPLAVSPPKQAAAPTRSSLPATPTEQSIPEDAPLEKKVDSVDEASRSTPTPAAAPPKVLYAPGQWAPDNTSGKKVYDFKFLMEFKNLIKASPKDMRQDLKDLQKVGEAQQMKNRSGGSDVVRGGLGWLAKGGSGARTKKAVRRIEMPAPAQPLKTSENRWVAIDKQELKAEDKMLSEVNAMLNKLTLEKFDTISDQILAYGEKLPDEMIKEFARIVFDKPVDQPFFSSMYARLCKKLRGEEKSKKKGGEAGQATFGTRFKDGLISLTREEFSKDRTPENERLAELTKKQKTLQREGKNLSEEEDEEKYRLAIARSRMFANIKFIGELFKYDLVAEKTIHNECLAPFLKDEEAEEDAIESIATLLNTSGSKLDATKSKERRASMDDYFKIIAKIIKRPKLPSRTKFMLQDLTELRMRQWQARREQAGPKTIDEIHKDAQAAELKKQQESLKTADRRRHGGPSGASQRRAPVATAQDGWSTVTSTSRRSERVDKGKLGFKTLGTRKSDDDIQLGPGSGGGFFGRPSGGWGKSSGKGSGPTTPTGRRSSNQFELLQEAEAQAAKNAMSLSRPSRPTPPPAAVPEEPSAPAAASITDDVRDRKIKGTLEEYLSLKDTNEAYECLQEIKELAPATTYAAFVTKTAQMAQEANDANRAAFVKLFMHLVDKGVLTKETVTEGLQPVLDLLEDTAIDVPKAPQNLADVVAAALAKNVLDVPAVLENDAVTAMYGDSSLKFVLQVLGAAGKHSQEAAREAAKAIRPLVEFLAEDRRKDETVADLADRYGASFVLAPTYGDALGKLLAGKPSTQETCAWVEANVPADKRGPAFIAELATQIVKAVYTSAAGNTDEEESLAKLFLPALLKYSEEDKGLPMHVLCATQKWAHEESNPQHFLDRWFRNLYDNNVVEEDELNEWEADKGISMSAEYPGKGAALVQVRGFLDDLKNAPEEPDPEAN